MKKLIPILMLIAALLAACGGAAPTETLMATPTAPEEKTVSVWVQHAQNSAGLQALMSEYSQQAGVSVELVTLLNDSQVLTALTGPESPDVLVLDSVGMVRYYSATGMLADLSAVTQTGGVDLNSFFPAALAVCQPDGILDCLPWTANPYVLYWNKDIFTEAELSPDIHPADLEQLADYADKLTRFGLEGQLEQIGFLPDYPASNLGVYAHLFGGYWYSDTSKELTVNSQPMIDALLWEQQFYTKYGENGVQAFLSKAGDNPFDAGKVAMLIEQANASFPSDLNLGVSAVPFSSSAQARAGTLLAQSDVIVLPAAAQSNTAVPDLLAWMLSAEVTAQVACGNGTFPSIRSAMQTACLAGDPRLEIVSSMLENPISYANLSTPASPELEAALKQVEEQTLHFGADPKLLLDQIQSQLEPKFHILFNGQ